jgi:uncharacterized protein YqeY
MSLKERIGQDIKNAMLAKEKEKLEVLRAIKAAILLEETKEGGEGSVTDEKGNQLLQKLHKQRVEAAKIYRDQNRNDLAEIEELQSEVIAHYLPKQLGDSEVEAILIKIVEETGAKGPSDMGKVMGKAMGELKGKAPGNLISSLVKKLLNK